MRPFCTQESDKRFVPDLSCPVLSCPHKSIVGWITKAIIRERHADPIVSAEDTLPAVGVHEGHFGMRPVGLEGNLQLGRC